METGLTNQEFLAALRETGVLALGPQPGPIRIVTHQDVDRADCERAVMAIEHVCAQVPVGH